MHHPHPYLVVCTWIFVVDVGGAYAGGRATWDGVGDGDGSLRAHQYQGHHLYSHRYQVLLLQQAVQALLDPSHGNWPFLLLIRIVAPPASFLLLCRSLDQHVQHVQQVQHLHLDFEMTMLPMAKFAPHLNYHQCVAVGSQTLYGGLPCRPLDCWVHMGHLVSGQMKPAVLDCLACCFPLWVESPEDGGVQEPFVPRLTHVGALGDWCGAHCCQLGIPCVGRWALSTLEESPALSHRVSLK